jgi:hypothetical protein
MARLALTLALLASAVAHADPPSDRLSRADLEAVTKAARARLPAVDTAAVAACDKQYPGVREVGSPGFTPENLAGAAACYRAANHPGLAILCWRMIDDDSWKLSHLTPPTPQQRAAAIRELSAMYEIIGSFSQAATIDEHYAELFAGEPDAPALLLRALCIDRQLGLDETARRDEFKLERLRHGKVDAPAECQVLHPIVVPAGPASAPASHP